jgi:hypothetical protein
MLEGGRKRIPGEAPWLRAKRNAAASTASPSRRTRDANPARFGSPTLWRAVALFQSKPQPHQPTGNTDVAKVGRQIAELLDRSAVPVVDASSERRARGDDPPEVRQKNCGLPGANCIAPARRKGSVAIC